MAANWLKYGLCVFSGLGIGFIIGSKTKKDKVIGEYEDRIDKIRRLYREKRKMEKEPGVDKKEESEMKPDIQNKTSIQVEKLSKKKEAVQAEKRYSVAFKNASKPDIQEDTLDEDQAEKPSEWKDYIHIVDEMPEDNDYRNEVLNYYADGVLTYSVTDKKVPDEDIVHMIGGENTLKLLDEDGCNELYVVNDLFQINYTIIFRYQEWADVVKEEPYKAES